MQELFTETRVRPSDLVMPLFIDEGISRPAPISTMPGQSRLPVGGLPAVAGKLDVLGLRAAILFGIPKGKDPGATRAYAPDGVIQRSVRAIKKAGPDFVVATDVCACEYTDHGHCGIIGDTGGGQDLLNDPSLELMNRIAVSHAEAGADIVAPSCMLDGMVGSIRMALDDAGFEDVLLMSYSGKFASGFYGPFREAAQGAPKFGDRRSHQMDPGNVREALRETALDVAEGADMLMVKPALAYLDVIRAVHMRYPQLPLVAYNVSGEYAMVKAAAANGWLDEARVTLEILTGIRRAGADLIITYHAKEAARWLQAA